MLYITTFGRIRMIKMSLIFVGLQQVIITGIKLNLTSLAQGIRF